MLEWFETDITDAAGDVVARVRREVYVREKKRVTATKVAPQPGQREDAPQRAR